MILTQTSPLQGSLRVPGDKSISHRALLFGALANGTTEISGLLRSADVLSTWRCLEALGCNFIESKDSIRVIGMGIEKFKQPDFSLDCGNSGTTMRLLAGVLAACPYSVQLIGDKSLSRRPMQRIAAPLTQMGARFELTHENFAPFWVHGTRHLHSIRYELPIASAQLKSAILLAGLFAHGETRILGPIKSRDHTERLLTYMGASIETPTSDTLLIHGGQKLESQPIQVPGDFSSAAFWIVAATLVPGSDILLTHVSLNPTRIGLLHVLQRMGARIEIETSSEFPEPVGSIRVRSASLQGIQIEPKEIPGLIDEIPLVAVLAAFAEGRTSVQGAEELRVKETDRIEAIVANLRAIGGEIDSQHDGFSVIGPQTLRGGVVQSFGDHRIAMAFSIVALAIAGSVEIKGHECVGISYPGFYSSLEDLLH